VYRLFGRLSRRGSLLTSVEEGGLLRRLSGALFIQRGTSTIHKLQKLGNNTDSDRFLMSIGLPGSSLLDSIVFNKVKEATGGRLRFCFNGAAPIARETQEFISMAVTPMVSGYGSTETTA